MPITARASGWVLETRSTGYAFGFNPQGRLVHSYWGAKLPQLGDYPAPFSSEGWASFNGPGQLEPEEYPGYGGTSYIDPCLKVTFADGVRDLLLQLDSAEVGDDADELRIHLRDAAYPFRVTLHYRVHAVYDLIERWVTVTNDGDTPIAIERIWSAQWHMPLGEEYRLTHLSGRWLDEMHLRREPLLPGIKVLESRRLTTSHHHSPWFALDCRPSAHSTPFDSAQGNSSGPAGSGWGTADQDSGEVWFGVLAWSGNWKLAAEVTDFGSTRVNIGINDWDFTWRLVPGETFTTPASYAGYTRAGFGGASRQLHDFIRDCILPHGQLEHKVLYNSWEATFFDVDQVSQVELARHAAAMGVELFVIDDGWFHGRDSDRAGLGDWWPDQRKFPNGLTPLIAQVNALGMDFGLWIEPEMVNPNSDLYRAQPDWVIHFPTRPRTEARNQLILNFARADVQAYIIEQIDRLLSENKITFIKWDMNRNVSEPGWPDAPGDQRELWVRYVQGLYHVWGSLRARHPAVVWQSCSGGGGRADLGILRLADQIWVSDQTEAAARLAIQEGFSQIFPANTMEAWVTDVGADRRSLAFRFHVSMCGSLGVGGHLAHWSEQQRAEAAEWIALYKELRPIIQFGDQFRLRSAQAHPFSAVQYVSKDRDAGVLFAFRTHLPDPISLPPIRLRGLDPQARYQIEGEASVRSGLAWMADGLHIQLRDFESTVRRIQRVD